MPSLTTQVQPTKALVATLILSLVSFGCGRFTMEAARNGRVVEVSGEKTSKPCQLPFSNHGLCSEITFGKLPNGTQDTSEFDLQFSPLDASAGEAPAWIPSPEAISVKVWMPDMSHPPESAEILPTEDPFRFRVKNVPFTMPGKWEIIVTLQAEEPESETARTIHIER